MRATEDCAGSEEYYSMCSPASICFFLFPHRRRGEQCMIERENENHLGGLAGTMGMVSRALAYRR